MSSITNLRSTIVPKSDQLNAEQLLAGDLTITVSDVRMGSDEQPVILHYQNDEGRPFKPCKTMRKLLIFAWGEDGRDWIGKSMTVYNDQAVRFGGMVVGGIRISHLSHIEREISLSLTATKGKKAQHTIKPLAIVTLDQVLKAIAQASTRSDMNAAKDLALKLTDERQAQAAQDAFNARTKQLRRPASTHAPAAAPATGMDAFAQRIAECKDLDVLDLIADDLRTLPDGPEKDSLNQAYRDRREDLSA